MKALLSKRTLTNTVFIGVAYTLLANINIAHASVAQWPLIASGEVRYLKVIKVYQASLYSPHPIDSNTILNSNISKCLKLDYKVDLTTDKFRLATQKILERQYKPEYLKSIQTPLEQLQQSYKPVKKGDSYTLCYNAKTKKLSLDFNETQVANIQSETLAKAYLGIWLSNNKPISRPLYNRLLKK